MKNLIETLRSKKTGYGHFSISIEMDGQELKTTTTNTMAIDAAFDDSYNDGDNSERYYESREEAQEALVNEILKANDYDKEILKANDYDKEVRVLKALKERHARGSIDKYLAYKGIDTLLEEVGNLDNFRQMLLDAGYAEKYTFRVVREVEAQIQALSFFQSNNEREGI